MTEAVISGVILGLCALLMFGIGISQIKSKKPVSFYSGEEAPAEDKLSDVKAWNKKHGIMWILYGICIVFAWVCDLFISDNLSMVLPFLACLLLPIPLMVFYHHKLIKKYYIK